MASRRYAQREVDSSIDDTDRGVFTPHAQIVLAGEVAALRDQCRDALICVEHGILTAVPAGGRMRECWQCNEGRILRERVATLQSALRAATACPEARRARDGTWRCWYRKFVRAQVAFLQSKNEQLRADLAEWKGRRP